MRRTAPRLLGSYPRAELSPHAWLWSHLSPPTTSCRSFASASAAAALQPSSPSPSSTADASPPSPPSPFPEPIHDPFARIRAWRDDTRPLRAFLRAPSADLLLPASLTSTVDALCSSLDYNPSHPSSPGTPAHLLALHSATRYAVLHRVLSEVRQRLPWLTPTRLLDAAFTTGHSAWALHGLWGDAVKEYRAVGAQRPVAAVGKEAVAPLAMAIKHVPALLSAVEGCDVVLCGYGLSEAGKARRRGQLDLMWRSVRPGGVLVLVEEGTQDGFDIVRSARQYLLQEYGGRRDGKAELGPLAPTVVAPCGHDVGCPKGTRGVCAFAQRILWSTLPHASPYRRVRTSNRLGGILLERFSYVVLHKGPVRPPATAELPLPAAVYEGRYHRVLSPPLLRGKHVTMDLCTTEGKEERWTVGKYSAGLEGGYRQGRDTRWGDLWQFDKRDSVTQLRKERRKDRAKEDVPEADGTAAQPAAEGEEPVKEEKGSARQRRKARRAARAGGEEEEAEWRTGDPLEKFAPIILARRRALGQLGTKRKSTIERTRADSEGEAHASDPAQSATGGEGRQEDEAGLQEKDEDHDTEDEAEEDEEEDALDRNSAPPVSRHTKQRV